MPVAHSAAATTVASAEATVVTAVAVTGGAIAVVAVAETVGVAVVAVDKQPTVFSHPHLFKQFFKTPSP